MLRRELFLILSTVCVRSVKSYVLVGLVSCIAEQGGSRNFGSME